MSNLIRHAILKDNVVVNAIEYETIQTGCPEGLEDVIAIVSDDGQIGWVYADGVFTNPNPPAPPPVPTYKDLRAQAYPSIPDQLDTIFHSGLDGWKEQIQAVKDKYPKEVV